MSDCSCDRLLRPSYDSSGEYSAWGNANIPDTNTVEDLHIISGRDGNQVINIPPPKDGILRDTSLWELNIEDVATDTLETGPEPDTIDDLLAIDSHANDALEAGTTDIMSVEASIVDVNESEIPDEERCSECDPDNYTTITVDPNVMSQEEIEALFVGYDDHSDTRYVINGQIEFGYFHLQGRCLEIKGANADSKITFTRTLDKVKAYWSDCFYYYYDLTTFEAAHLQGCGITLKDINLEGKYVVNEEISEEESCDLDALCPRDGGDQACFQNDLDFWGSSYYNLIEGITAKSLGLNVMEGSNLTIRNSHFTTGSGLVQDANQAVGLFISGNGNTIENCIFEDDPSQPYAWRQFLKLDDNVKIRNNEFHVRNIEGRIPTSAVELGDKNYYVDPAGIDLGSEHDFGNNKFYIHGEDIPGQVVLISLNSREAVEWPVVGNGYNSQSILGDLESANPSVILDSRDDYGEGLIVPSNNWLIQ